MLLVAVCKNILISRIKNEFDGCLCFMFSLCKVIVTISAKCKCASIYSVNKNFSTKREHINI